MCASWNLLGQMRAFGRVPRPSLLAVPRVPTHLPGAASELHTVSRARASAIAISLGFTLVGGVTPVLAAYGIAPPSADCQAGTSAQAKTRADAIMGGTLRLGTQGSFALPANPTWRETPFNGDINWLFNFHTLRWLLPLFQAGRETGDTRYTSRASFLLHDWVTTNPRSAPAHPMAWNNHSTAWRASVMACAVDDLAAPSWLISGLNAHGRALADSAFYVKVGNHALNQAVGLLDVACRVSNGRWKSLAASRLATLVVASVDSEGVANEQAIGYQLYNYVKYLRARGHLVGCKVAVPSGFARVQLMPNLLAFATAPDGRYEQLGDTDLVAARSIPGTTAEYAATAGASGPRPTASIKRFAAGYLFARSGWGVARPFDQETFWSLRFGRGRILHGHADGMSLTLSAFGKRLLVDPGKYTYTANAWRRWFVGRTAHNVVSVDGLTYNASQPTAIGTQARSNFLLARLSNNGYSGVTTRRSVMWSRAGNYLLVDDALTATTTRTFRQDWHLGRGSAPTLSGNRLDTHQTGSNLAIVQLVGQPTKRIITGSTVPIQGWISRVYGTRLIAPVLDSSIRGRTARFLTLLVPYGGARPAISGRIVKLTSTGYVVDVRIGSRVERITVGTTNSIVRLGS